MSERSARIYKVTNLLDGKIYIGCTTRTLEARWSSHLRSSKNTHDGYALHAAIRRDGVQNFLIELLEELPNRKQGAKREGTLIVLHNTSYPHGYNKLFQGSRRPPESPETRAKKSAAHKGKKWTPAQRSAITAAQQTPEYRAKMRAAVAKRKRGPLSPETKEKIRQTLLKRNRN